jgi:hypothetical protein
MADEENNLRGGNESAFTANNIYESLSWLRGISRQLESLQDEVKSFKTQLSEQFEKRAERSEVHKNLILFEMKRLSTGFWLFVIAIGVWWPIIGKTVLHWFGK